MDVDFLSWRYEAHVGHSELTMWLFVAVNWLDHSKTLREQGIDVEETLLLRRKFFFSDQNVDARDPVQLNLLYVQVSVEGKTEGGRYLTETANLHLMKMNLFNPLRAKFFKRNINIHLHFMSFLKMIWHR